MKINVRPFIENLKSINAVIADFVYIDCDSDEFAFYMSTDTQAMKIPLEITDIKDDEKKVYVINKNEFVHLMGYAKEFIELDGDYSYNANDSQIKGKFEKNENYADELESRKILFDNEDDYDEFMEVTPSIMSSITRGSIFVAPDSIKKAERFLDIQNKKVFSYSNYRIYIDDINIDKQGLLSDEVIKSVQSLGVGTIVKSNKESYLVTNAQRSIFEYFAVPNDVDFHPFFMEGFQKKLSDTKTFNRIKFNITELKSKLDYISYYANKNSNQMCFFKTYGDKILISDGDINSIEINDSEIEKTEEFEEMSVPLNCGTLQLMTSKVGKDAESLTMYVSNKNENKLVVIVFGDSNETVILAKLNI